MPLGATGAISKLFFPPNFLPQLLGRSGVHTQKITDHQHYWEDVGATYHQRYTTFDLVRAASLL